MVTPLLYWLSHDRNFDITRGYDLLGFLYIVAIFLLGFNPHIDGYPMIISIIPVRNPISVDSPGVLWLMVSTTEGSTEIRAWDVSVGQAVEPGTGTRTTDHGMSTRGGGKKAWNHGGKCSKMLENARKWHIDHTVYVFLSVVVWKYIWNDIFC